MLSFLLAFTQKYQEGETGYVATFLQLLCKTIFLLQYEKYINVWLMGTMLILNKSHLLLRTNRLL